MSQDDPEFLRFVAEHFDADFYLSLYHDVAQAGVDPLEHWLLHGLGEGRCISPLVEVRLGKIARRSTNRNWRHYRWRGDDVAVRLIAPIPPEVIQQIANQARHDPELLAGGLAAVANRGHRESVGVIDVLGLQRAIQGPTEVLVMVPDLDVSDDQTLVAGLLATLTGTGTQSVRTMVTDKEDEENARSPVPEPFAGTHVFFWRDYWIADPGLRRLAQLVRILSPRILIVANSRMGYELVVQFGRVIAQSTKIFCLYTEGPRGRELSSYYPRRTLQFAAAVTDDAALGIVLRERYGDLLGHEIIVLPRPSSEAFVESVAALLRQS